MANINRSNLSERERLERLWRKSSYEPQRSGNISTRRARNYNPIHLFKPDYFRCFAAGALSMLVFISILIGGMQLIH